MKIFSMQFLNNDTYPAKEAISGYCYPKMYQPPGNDVWKCNNIQVLLPEIYPTFLPSGQMPCHVSWRFQIRKFPGIVTWKFDQFQSNNTQKMYQFCYMEMVNLWVTIPCNSQTKQKGNYNLQRLKTSRYCYQDILQPPGNDTRKCNNILVSLPEGWIWQKKNQKFKFFKQLYVPPKKLNKKLGSISTCI